MRRYLSAPFLPFVLLITPMASLSHVERQIVEQVERNNAAAVPLLERIVNINSGTMNHEGVAAVGRIFQGELDTLGFDTRWISMKEVNRSGHLFAERAGNTGKRLLLIGHLDTVFEKDSPFQRFESDGSLARGPGVEDMKGGDVVILYALKALHAAGLLEDRSITVALIGDEEDTGDPLEISRGDLLKAARRSDIALGFEGSVGGLGKATVARRGFTGWTVEVTATSGHSSQIFKPEFGGGAIFEAARILNAFRHELLGEDYLTISPGIIVGGTTHRYDQVLSLGEVFGKTNVIPQKATVAGDLRFISAEQLARAKERMRVIVSRALPHTQSEIVFEDSYPAMSPTAGNRKLLAELDQICRDLGYGPVTEVDPGDRGAADVSFVAHLVDALDGLGAVGAGAHSEEEKIDLVSFPKATKRAALLIYRLTR